ncbi:hypothetical protein [Geotalea sp. SG265]|uniref:hypothetical protein n=1 Tax=Geotalea sp. SG265 TaxID=2922867 RepID=UPI001FAF0274|nr:hypothetical protein [Geotalea sp. SG265]
MTPADAAIPVSPCSVLIPAFEINPSQGKNALLEKKPQVLYPTCRVGNGVSNRPDSVKTPCLSGHLCQLHDVSMLTSDKVRKADLFFSELLLLIIRKIASLTVQYICGIKYELKNE